MTTTAQAPTVEYTELLIDGEFRAAADASTFFDVNPATESALAQVAAAGERDVDAAVAAARREFDDGAWSRMGGHERGALLYRLADLIERELETFAGLEALDVGKPIGDPRLLDVPMAISTFRYFAGWADKIEGRTIPTPGYFGRPTHSYTVREPVGVVGAITPWNAPTMIAAWKLAPALAAGCTIVLKPSEDAPLTALLLGQLALEAGFPAGVVNVVPGLGDPAGAALVRHPGVDKVSFTGSPEVGREIQRGAADTFKRVTLELGGKSPQIILADADIEAAVAGTAMGLFFNAGEICAAGSRILVERSVRDEVVDALTAAASQVKLGDPLDPDTTMGALINESQLERVLGYVESGRSEGATIAIGGGRPDRDGYFVEPTIFTDAHNGMRIAQEEIFGPVGTVLEFDDADEAVRIANDTSYGLAATLWTSDLSRAHSIASRVRAGSIWINGWAAIDPRLPWGGMKGSGIGRELGWSGIEASTQEKVVTVVL